MKVEPREPIPPFISENLDGDMVLVVPILAGTEKIDLRVALDENRVLILIEDMVTRLARKRIART